MEVDLIQWLQRLSGTHSYNFWDKLFYAITQMGDQLFFMLVAATVFWCVDKRFGFRLITVYILGAAIIEGLKLAVTRLRPFQKHPSTIKSIYAQTSGYSFPSGHSHSIANLSTQVCAKYGKKFRYLYIIGLSLTLLVMLSRMYLGQHYLSDVIVGATLGILIALGFTYLFKFLKNKEEVLAFVFAPVAFVLCFFTQSHNILLALGALSAFAIGYYLEKQYVCLDVKARLWQQVLKVIIGLLVAVGIKEGFKLFLPQDIPVLYSFFRYFLIGLWASLGAPTLFRYVKIFNKNFAAPKQAAQAIGNPDAQSDRKEEE